MAVELWVEVELSDFGRVGVEVCVIIIYTGFDYLGGVLGIWFIVVGNGERVRCIRLGYRELFYL